MRRAFITGVGMISPLGEGREAFFNNLIEGRSAVREIEGFDTSSFNSHLGGEVRGFKPEIYMGRKMRGLNRTTRFLTAAMKLAVEDAGLSPEETSDSGVIVGTAFGNSAHAITYAQKLLKEGPDEMFPLDAMDMPSNSSVNFVSVFFAIKNFARTISAGFTSTHDALGNALQLIRTGRAKRIIVAGMEQLSPELFTIFNQRGLLARATEEAAEGARPFNKTRNGFVLSEGGYALTIEEDQLAGARGVKPLAEITGFANGFVGGSKLSSNQRLERLSSIINASLANAAARSSEIDLIYTSANGLRDPDLLECLGLQAVFQPEMPSICAIKSQMGEAYGASGAMQASVAALSLSIGKKPLLNPPASEDVDPACHSVLKTKNPLVESPQKVIINGLDLAGNFSCLILEKYK
ncbi:MAG TPA: beta-ketoacyl synthase N-terminal-like domain-containing protein [Blastocatellia bacterium]|nr:beta-ketoacyl synthase N-terminal-like domain-containing protein [Blastocatellia bacterium]